LADECRNVVAVKQVSADGDRVSAGRLDVGDGLTDCPRLAPVTIAARPSSRRVIAPTQQLG
jgi:hypothetical protein